MHLWILHLLPHLRQQNMDLFFRHFPHITQDSQTKSLKTIQRLDQITRPQLFEARILGPRADRQLDLFGLDIHKPRVAHPLFEFRTRRRFSAHGLDQLDQRLGPLVRLALGLLGIVVGIHGYIVVLEFRPAAGPEVSFH